MHVSSTVQKNLRVSPDTARLMALMAAHEGRKESELLEDALAVYVQHRALAERRELDLPAEAFEDGRTAVAAMVAALDKAVGSVLGARVAAPAVPVVPVERESAADKLRARRRKAAPAAG
jgi:O-methyltransferase involved in polyketide biosynthesis